MVFYTIGADYPVENVSWYDAIYFCNKLSELAGLTPVYSVGGKTDVSQWGYTPHAHEKINEKVMWNKKANGYRLPETDEWYHAADGGKYSSFKNPGKIDEVGWYGDNSGGKSHPVAQKSSNGYGMYDVRGNVWEWCWDDLLVEKNRTDGRYSLGGSFSSTVRSIYRYTNPADSSGERGFRLFRTTK